MFHDGAAITRLPEMDYEAKLFDPPVTKVTLTNRFTLSYDLLHGLFYVFAYQNIY